MTEEGTTEGWREQYRKIPEYNGWTNKPTWAVHLILTNTQETDTHYRAIALRAPDLYRAEDSIRTEAERYFERVLGRLPTHYVTRDAEIALDHTMIVKELFEWALAYVDWRSIAVALREQS